MKHKRSARALNSMLMVWMVVSIKTFVIEASFD